MNLELREGVQLVVPFIEENEGDWQRSQAVAIKLEQHTLGNKMFMYSMCVMYNIR